MKTSARLAVGGAVLSASVVALAFPGIMGIAFSPDVVQVPLIPNVPMTNQSEFFTDTAPITIDSIDPTTGCLAGITATPSSFTIDNTFDSVPITVTCPAIASFGIERCQLEAKSGGTTVATLTALCHVQGGDLFTPDVSSLSFMDIPVGGSSAAQTVTLSTPDGIGGVAVQLGDNGGNFVIDDPCDPGGVPGCDATIASPGPATLAVSIRCTPQTDGPHAAMLYVVDKQTGRYLDEMAFSIDCTTVAATVQDIELSPPTLSRSLQVGDTQGDMIAVSNSSMATDPLTISSISVSSSSHWTVMMDPSCPATTGCTLNPGEMITLGVTFHPMTAGSGLDATITINSDDPDTPAAVASLFGQGLGADGLQATPPALDLGTIRIGRSAMQTTTLSLTGPNPVTLGLLDFENDLAGATATPDGTDVTPSQTVDVMVAMAPATEGPFADNLIVNGLIDGTTPTSVTIPVTGIAVRAEATVPATVHAGSFCLGQPYAPIEIAMVSTGSGAFDMIGKPILEQTSSPFTISYTSPLETEYPRSLAPSESALISVALRAPGAVGTYSDRVLWQTDLDTPPATAIDAEIISDGGAVSPMALTFMPQPVRQTSAKQMITIQNCGTEPLGLGGLTFEPNDEFRDASDGALPSELAPLQTATLLVDFTPRGVGVRTATLTIATSKGPRVVQLLGTGIAGAFGDGSRESLYACSCGSSEPGGALVIVVALGFVVIPRRRRYLRAA